VRSGCCVVAVARAASAGRWECAVGRAVGVHGGGVRGDPYDHHWQARTICPDCEGRGWAKVTDAEDLLDVYNSQAPEEVWCDDCDAPGLAAG
jgi:hypothetical protein